MRACQWNKHGIITQAWNLLRLEPHILTFGFIKTFMKKFTLELRMRKSEQFWLNSCCFTELKKLSKDQPVFMKWVSFHHKLWNIFNHWEKNFLLNFVLMYWPLLNPLNMMTILFTQPLDALMVKFMRDFWIGVRTKISLTSNMLEKNLLKRLKRPNPNSSLNYDLNSLILLSDLI